MIEFEARSIPRKLRAACIAVLAPLALAACGGGGGGTALKSSASIAPVNSQASTNMSVTDPSKREPAVAGKLELAKNTDLAATSESAQKDQKSAKKPPVKTAKAGRVKTLQKTALKPPYRKIRVNKSIKGEAAQKALAALAVKSDKKSARKSVTKTVARKMAKPLRDKKIAIAKKPPAVKKRVVVKKSPVVKKLAAIRKPVAKKMVKKAAVQKAAVKKAAKPAVRTVARKAKPRVVAPATPMVPMQVIPVQIMPQDAPQDIADAFNETKKRAQAEPEKMAAAKTAQAVQSFGSASHRFSGQ